MELPKRKPNRLINYDYSSQGAYFVTICTEGKRKTLCKTVGDGFPVPNAQGRIMQQIIMEIPAKYNAVHVDKYVVMPNHIHLLLFISAAGGTGNPSPTLGNVIGWLKYEATKRINLERGTPGDRIFQRSYHDHVIRGEEDYQKIWEYIDSNPRLWAKDCFYME